MKKVLLTAMMVAMSVGMNAQTVQKQVVEEGGTGPFKSEVVAMPPAQASPSIVRRT